MKAPELDPEVLADLRLREASVFDSSRIGRAPEWQRPEIVAEWPCRNKACRVKVGVTPDGVERLAMFNRYLTGRGEEPIVEADVMVCVACQRLLASQIARKNRKQTDALADVIRALKSSRNPRSETELIARAQKLHHPDLPGLLDAIEQRLANSKTPKRRDNS